MITSSMFIWFIAISFLFLIADVYFTKSGKMRWTWLNSIYWITLTVMLLILAIQTY